MHCINTQIINIGKLCYADSNGGIFVVLRCVNPELCCGKSHRTNSFEISTLRGESVLNKQVKCVLPPFVRSKRQFTRSEVYQGKRIARARIHVERVIGRLKEFQLLQNTLPLTMVDLCDHIWIIAGAIVNMQPPLVQ